MILTEAQKIGSVDIIYFEGGEPFLAYRLMLEGITMSRKMGFDVGIVTNGYWAKDEGTARKLLKPIADAGIADLSISCDDYHSDGKEDYPAEIAIKVAKDLGLPMGTITIEEPTIAQKTPETKGKPIIGGGVRFRGRAVEKLADNLPKREWKEFNSCPDEEFEDPGRVHIDCFGNVFLCQGICLGNINDSSLSELINEYSLSEHPIFHYIEKGGPALLARQYGIPDQIGFVDECHLCYTVRKNLLDKYPKYLAPKHVYGYQ
jgi:MoaA/NifB/PqqE/SkfB family radical SAM enzyme